VVWSATNNHGRTMLVGAGPGRSFVGCAPRLPTGRAIAWNARGVLGSWPGWLLVINNGDMARDLSRLVPGQADAAALRAARLLRFPSGGGDRADAVEGSSFCISMPNGDVYPDHPHGLFAHDTRILSAWSLTVNGQALEPLAAETHLAALGFVRGGVRQPRAPQRVPL
jgi:hypothetical protein